MKNTSRFPIYILLDNIRSALNVGAIFRTCDATNVEKLCLCGITAYPPHNRIPKTALGSVDYVPWKYYKTTEDALDEIRNESTIKPSGFAKGEPCLSAGKPASGWNLTIISVELTNKSKSIWKYKFKTPLALIFGNEISGISKDILKKSDTIVKIPMFGKKKSLNVATSCGIVLYEVLRQIKT